MFTLGEMAPGFFDKSDYDWILKWPAKRESNEANDTFGQAGKKDALSFKENVEKLFSCEIADHTLRVRI